MRPVVVLEQITAPIETVFHMASDVPHFAENITDILQIEQLTKGPVQLGTKWRETRIVFGKEATEEMEFTKFDPPNSYEVSAESHGSKYLTVFQFTQNENQTHIVVTFSTTPQTVFARFINFIMGSFMSRMISKCLTQDLLEIKTKLEQLD